MFEGAKLKINEAKQQYCDYYKSGKDNTYVYLAIWASLSKKKVRKNSQHTHTKFVPTEPVSLRIYP